MSDIVGNIRRVIRFVSISVKWTALGTNGARPRFKMLADFHLNMGSTVRARCRAALFSAFRQLTMQRETFDVLPVADQFSRLALTENFQSRVTRTTCADDADRLLGNDIPSSDVEEIEEYAAANIDLRAVASGSQTVLWVFNDG